MNVDSDDLGNAGKLISGVAALGMLLLTWWFNRRQSPEPIPTPPPSPQDSELSDSMLKRVAECVPLRIRTCGKASLLYFVIHSVTVGFFIAMIADSTSDPPLIQVFFVVVTVGLVVSLVATCMDLWRTILCAKENTRQLQEIRNRLYYTRWKQDLYSEVFGDDRDDPGDLTG